MEKCLNSNDFHDMSGHKVYMFINEIIDDFCGICCLDSTQYVPNIWTTDQQFRQFVDNLKTVLLNMIEIRGKHECLQRLPEDIQKVMVECIELRRAELRKAMVNNTVADNHPVLKDFFWKLNYVLDSNSMNDLNQPLVNLDLNISEPKEGIIKESLVSIELNAEELSQVIKTLEEAQQELRQSY